MRTFRALEFDRIVAPWPILRSRRPGTSGWRTCEPLTDAAARRRGAEGDERRHAIPRRPSRLSAARAVGPRVDHRRARRRGTRARSAAAARAGRLPRVDRAFARRRPATRRRCSRSFGSWSSAIASFKGEIADVRTQDRSVRRGRRQRQPGARQHPRTPAPAAREAADDARVVRPRTRDGEVPAGAGRHRSQRPLRADGARRTSIGAFPASCTAPRRAAPASFSSR